MTCENSKKHFTEMSHSYRTAYFVKKTRSMRENANRVNKLKTLFSQETESPCGKMQAGQKIENVIFSENKAPAGRCRQDNTLKTSFSRKRKPLRENADAAKKSFVSRLSV